MSEITDTANWLEIVFKQISIDSWKSTKLLQDDITQRMVDWVSQHSDTVPVGKVAKSCIVHK